jgi:hypothetical protein
MIPKKQYIKPIINLIVIDNSISLVMMSSPIDPPPPPGIGSNKKNSTPFASPFGDKPFG